MLSIIEKAFNNTISITLYIVLITIFIGFVAGWIYIPIGIIKINKKLKEIKELLEKTRNN